MRSMKKDAIFLLKVAFFAAVARVLFACAYYFYYIRVSKMPLYSFDGETYSITAWYITLLLKGVNVLALPAQYLPVDCWINDRLHVIIASFGGKFPSLSTYGIGYYAYLLGAFYYIFGYVPLLFRIFNILTNIASAFISYRIANENFGEKCARITFVIMLIFPYQFFYSASLQRDTIINFLCIMAIFAIFGLKVSDKLRRKGFFVSLLLSCMILLYALRFSVVYMILLSLLLYIFIILYRKYKCLVTLLLVLSISIPPVRFKFIYACKKAILTMLTYHISFASCGGWIYKLFSLDYYIFYNPIIWPTMSGLTFMEISRLVMLSLKSFLTEPFIFSGLAGKRLIVLPEMIVWYIVLFYAIIGIAVSLKRMRLRRVGLLIFLIVFSLVIGMSGSNMDALIRHRGMISFVYVIFASYGMGVINEVISKK